MKRTTTILAAILSTTVLADAQVIVSDNYNVTANGTGFGLNQGLNTLLAPPRFTGTAAEGLQYFSVGTARASTFYTITDDKLQVNADNSIARFSFSNNGTSAYDFSSDLGSSLATAATPLTYDIKISMANHENGTQRFSFGLATAEGDATTWDFGVQLYQSTSTSDRNRIQTRIDHASSGLTEGAAGTVTGTGGDINATMTTQGAGTFGNEVNFLIRVTDAGAESGANYNSRIQVSLNGGNTFVYDTATDDTLVNGFRFDGAGRYFDFDIAGGNGVSGYVTYDNFSVTVVTPVPEPSTTALLTLGAIGGFCFLRSRKNFERI
jgi:hypothetical protein